MWQIVMSFFSVAVLTILSLYLIYCLFKIAYVVFKSKPKGKYKIKKHWKIYKIKFMNADIQFLFDFVKWIIYDLIYGKNKVKIFGLWAFLGYFGEGSHDEFCPL